MDVRLWSGFYENYCRGVPDKPCSVFSNRQKGRFPHFLALTRLCRASHPIVSMIPSRSRYAHHAVDCRRQPVDSRAVEWGVFGYQVQRRLTRPISCCRVGPIIQQGGDDSLYPCDDPPRQIEAVSRNCVGRNRKGIIYESDQNRLTPASVVTIFPLVNGGDRGPQSTRKTLSHWTFSGRGYADVSRRRDRRTMVYRAALAGRRTLPKMRFSEHSIRRSA